jgi:hypothetical protein
MAETLKTLIGIQDQVWQCRRLAAEIGDRETALRLYQLALELEERAREVDQLAYSPKTA